jgi:hypothetical protein
VFLQELLHVEVRDDPELLPYDGGEITIVDGLIPGYEISSLPDGKLVRWSTASCALALACQPSKSIKRKKENF